MKTVLRISLLFVLLLSLSLPFARAEGWLNEAAAPDAVQNATDSAVYDAADAAGTVVNADRPQDPTPQEKIVYSFTPLDVVLILDVSDSMSRTDEQTGKTLLGYAKEAATAFVRTLLSVNPASRVGVVAFSDTSFAACGLLGLNDQDSLLSAVNALSTGSRTNTGGGFASAGELLNAQAMDGRRRMVLMLTDGQANEGDGDPVAYAVGKGKECAGMGYVYNIGLVGGLSGSEKKETRKVLEAGYETRYFEVDFDQVADAGSLITMITSSIAMSASSAEMIDEATGSVFMSDAYRLSVGPGFEARIERADGEYLSSFPEDRRDSASFGSLNQVDNDKHFALLKGDYVIYIRGSYDANSSYSLHTLRGETMAEDTLLSVEGWSHRSVGVRVTLADGEMTVEDESYDCLDVTAVDWDGNPTAGLEKAVTARVRSNAMARCAPSDGAPKVSQMHKGDHVQVLAYDPGTEYYFVTFTDEDGLVSRGWMSKNTLATPNGFVPDMAWLDGEYTVGADTQAHRTPDAFSAVAFTVEAQTTVNLLHAERSADGSEWAYVSVPDGKTPRYAYVPASALSGFETVAPEGFRVGHNISMYVTELDFPVLPIKSGLKLKVYSCPDRSSWRGANKKAMVNTNGGLRAMGWVDNNWLFVRYGTTVGNSRVGYIAAEDINADVPNVPLVAFNPIPAVITRECLMSDDPLNFSEEIAVLETGTEVMWLASYAHPETGAPLDYIETKADGKTVRAFIERDCLKKLEGEEKL